MTNHQKLQYTPPERQMRSKIPQHLIVASPLNISPGPRPIIRPISSPMTPITPLVLSESNYQKELFDSHDSNQYGYFYHGNNIQHYQSPLSQLPHRYGYSINHHKTPTQPPAPFTPSSPSPLSSGASTPTCSTFFSSSSPNQFTILGNYSDQDSFQSNIVSTDDEDLCRGNTFLAQSSGLMDFDSEDGDDMFKDLIVTNPLDAGFYYQNPHHGYQQKAQYEVMVNGIGKCKNVDMNVHDMSIGDDAHDGGVEHPMSTMYITNINETMTNNSRTSSQHDDTRFHEILQGMDNMGIVDFH